MKKSLKNILIVALSSFISSQVFASKETDKRQLQRDRQKVMSKKTQIQSQKKTASSASEKSAFDELMRRFDMNDEIGFEQRKKSFLKNHPKSHLVDDVIYTSGLLLLANKNYGAALVQFNRVLNQYKNTNKASAAQFAKAVTLKRMNLNTQAVSAFRTVQKQFPGSQEALRAQNELKILGVK